VDNLINMKSMFQDCKSLCSIPNISKWNTKKVNNMNNIFNNCLSLSFLPDINYISDDCSECIQAMNKLNAK